MCITSLFAVPVSITPDSGLRPSTCSSFLKQLTESSVQFFLFPSLQNQLYCVSPAPHSQKTDPYQPTSALSPEIRVYSLVQLKHTSTRRAISTSSETCFTSPRPRPRPTLFTKDLIITTSFLCTPQSQELWVFWQQLTLISQSYVLCSCLLNYLVNNFIPS